MDKPGKSTRPDAKTSQPRNPVEPIHGVTYIVDYYAVLELQPDATDKEIERAIQKERVKCHPDRVATMSEGIQEEAQRRSRLIADAENALGERKSLYDQTLARFREKRPHYISNSGLAILNVDEYMAPDLLVSKLECDFSVILERENVVIGFDEGRLEIMKKLYESNPSDPTFTSLYREELGKQLEYIRAQESLAWANAGVLNATETRGNMMAYPDEYPKVVNERIERVGVKEIPEALDLRSKAILAGMAEPLILPEHSGEAATTLEEAASDTIAIQTRERVTQAFLRRTESIKALAREKQAVLEALLELSDIKYLRGNPGHSSGCIMVTMRNGEPNSAFLGESGKIKILEADFSQTTLEELMKDERYTNYDILTINHNPILKGECLMEVIFAFVRHLETE